MKTKTKMDISKSKSYTARDYAGRCSEVGSQDALFDVICIGADEQRVARQTLDLQKNMSAPNSSREVRPSKTREIRRKARIHLTYSGRWCSNAAIMARLMESAMDEERLLGCSENSC